MEIRTLLRCISLYEALSRAGFLEFRGEPCQLGQVFVDDADLRGKVVVVEVLCEMSPGVA